MENNDFQKEEQELVKNLHQQNKAKWYFGIPGIIIAFLIVGPLALPLVFLSPQLSKLQKIIISLVIIGLSILLIKVTMQSIEKIIEYYKIVFGFQEL